MNDDINNNEMKGLFLRNLCLYNKLPLINRGFFSPFFLMSLDIRIAVGRVNDDSRKSCKKVRCRASLIGSEQAPLLVCETATSANWCNSIAGWWFNVCYVLIKHSSASQSIESANARKVQALNKCNIVRLHLRAPKGRKKNLNCRLQKTIDTREF